MNPIKLKSRIESLLFVVGAPVRINKLARALRVQKKDIEVALEELANEFREQRRGLSILMDAGKAQLTTARKNARFVERFIKMDLHEKLTRAALETLAIIAYRGPISRAKIEAIRGVNSVFMLRTLMIRGLIERIRNPKDKRSYLYRVTFDLLRKLGVNKSSDLPQYSELNQNEALKIIEEQLESGERSPEGQTEDILKEE